MIRSLPILCLIMAACGSPQAERSDSVPSPIPAGEERVEGVVRVVGSAPVNVQVVLQPDTGRAIRLTGRLREELRRLAGIQVSVTGRASPSADPMAARDLEASSYEIGMVEGRPVTIGEIVEITSGQARLRTEDGEEIYLRGVPTELRVGQKVWVQGPRTLVVQSYGVLRP